mgnify:CR=1 FL=1
MKAVRHGDVILVSVTQIPDAAKQTAKGRVVLAEGEVTGHTHTVEHPSAVMLSDGMRRYLEIGDTCQLKHQEHKALKIEPGKYEILIEQEWDYFDQARKTVVD